MSFFCHGIISLTYVNIQVSVGKPCRCMQFIKLFTIYKSHDSLNQILESCDLYQILQIMCATPKCTMYNEIIITIVPGKNITCLFAFSIVTHAAHSQQYRWQQTCDVFQYRFVCGDTYYVSQKNTVVGCAQYPFPIYLCTQLCHLCKNFIMLCHCGRYVNDNPKPYSEFQLNCWLLQTRMQIVMRHCKTGSYNVLQTTSSYTSMMQQCLQLQKPHGFHVIKTLMQSVQLWHLQVFTS